MSDFISQFLEYTSAYESPTEFFYWSAVSAISAVMRDSAHILLGDTKIFPNLYVLIIANPAMRKAKPLNSVVELMKFVDNTKIIEGRTSIQAVIQRLGEIERRKNGNTISGASGIIFSEEISAMFTEDEATIPVLTDLYDFKSSYTSSLVSRGTTRLTNVVISLLGASNEELLKPIFNNRAIYGGLLSRCLIVYGDRVRHRNSLMYEDPRRYDPRPLQQTLLGISKLRGVFLIDDAARKFYDKWYNEYCPTLENAANKTGAEGRIHTNVLKLAMVLAVSKRCELVLKVEDIEDAINACLRLFTNYKRLTLGAGRSKDADPQIIFLKVLWEAGESRNYKLTRREVLYRSWGDISSEDLDKVTRTLLEAGLILQTDGKGTTIYSLTESAVKFFIEKKDKM